LAPREFLRAEILGKLEQLKLATFILEAKTIEDVLSHIQTIGRMLGHSASADALAAEMRQRITEIKARTAALPRPRLLYVLNSEPLITVGPDSFIGQLIELAGGANVAARAKTPYPRLNMEEVLKADPELLIFPVGAAEGIPDSEQRVLSARRWVLTMLALAGVSLLVMAASLRFGAEDIGFVDSARILFQALRGGDVRTDSLGSSSVILLQVRLPRVLLGFMVGGSLAGVGVGFQALLRNPLADPYVLGISSVAALGAAVAILFGIGTTGVAIHALPLCAFAGGLLAIVLVYRIAATYGRLPFHTLFLAGVIVDALRMVVYDDHLLLLPDYDIVGDTFLVAADMVARTVLAPAEIPVEIVTALGGGPLFIYLLVYRKSGLAV